MLPHDLTSRAMVLRAVGTPLVAEQRPRPEPGPGQVLLSVLACAVCRTDLHIVDGEVSSPLPRVLGHQIVGEVIGNGSGADAAVGQRVGVPWLGWTCGVCEFCQRGEENLCDRAEFTGCHRDGGFATHAVVDARYAIELDADADPMMMAPLLCGGLIGYRALRMAGDGERIGLYGFGSAAHILAQVLVHQGRQVFAFTRSDDEGGQAFARELGAAWAGGSDELPPKLLDAALVFAPVGSLVPAALRAVRKGGVVVCAGIHMSDIPGFPYELLWGERTVRSVANLTREDTELLGIAARAGVTTRTRGYALDDVNQALADLREGRIDGSAVVVVRAPTLS